MEATEAEMVKSEEAKQAKCEVRVGTNFLTVPKLQGKMLKTGYH